MTKTAFPVDQQARDQSLETRTSFLVQAPAGSGKTELLTRRLLKLLAEVDEPEHILAITFTIAATAEMRARVLDSLHDAEGPPPTDRGVYDLARAAMANSAKRGWDLLQQPERLNIQTIDAVCLTIAHQTPLLSRLGGSLSPTDKPQPLYDLAARRTLGRLGENSEISEALSALLQLRSASLTACQTLIAEMLGNRDQWGRVLGFSDPGNTWPEVRAKLEEPLQRLHTETVEKAQSRFAGHPTLEPELKYLLTYGCSNLDPDADLMLLRDVSHLRHLTSVKHWTCLCDFLMNKGGGWRKPNIKQGFIAGTKGLPAKERFKSLVAELDRHPELQSVLCELRDLPPAAYSDEESQMLRNLIAILRYAVAELRLVFAEQQVVDFVELGIAAKQVLEDERGGASELAADVAGRWSHVLVDEFQDTSRSQYRLLTLLAEGWESAGPATCFLVGDPMQSIYMFRQAEVELFERTRKYGLGEGTARVDLTPLQLQTNFRSHTELVNRLNQIFKQVFARNAEEEEDDEYHVAFVCSAAHERNVKCEPGVHIWPQLLPPKATSEQRAAALDDESKEVVRIIAEAQPLLEQRQAEGKDFKIAVLVRAKSHLERIAKRLRAAGIRFRAVEIEPLGQRQEVRDLAALTRALLHPMNRIAWLTILRAPWCGLTLADLHVLCGSDDKAFASQPVITLLRERIPLLSDDGQVRAGRVHTVLEHALRGAHRQVSLSRWVERTWVTLGGNACVDREAYENVRAFFNMLDKLGPDAGGLEDQLEALCAQPDPFADERWCVQLMTIHKAKGLGFEVVIVPAMERRTRGEGSPMVRWIEQTRLVGATEEEEQVFVVAPIGRSGQSSGIYGWIGTQQTERQDDETKRLLYVAATRARETLHLLGTATVRVQENDKGPLTPGDKHSLLGIAWDALRPDFDRFFRERPAVVAEQTVMAFPEPTLTIPLRRLPSDWTPKSVAGPVTNATVVVTERWERPLGSLASRAFGTVVHGLLEDLSNLAAVDGDWQSAIREVGGWRERAFAMLRASGQPRAEAAQESGKVVQTLSGVLNDPVGRWIVGARNGAETEASFSAWSSTEVVQTLRGDRMFWAGAEPGSLGDSHLWIVDYKTGKPGGQKVEDWLQEEKRKYLPQLEAYAEVMRKVHGPETPIRMALYFPLLPRLLWW